MLLRNKYVISLAAIVVTAAILLVFLGSRNGPDPVPARAATTPTAAIWGVQVNDNLSIGGGSPSYWTYVPALESKLGRPFAGWRRNGITGADDLTAYRKAFDRGWHFSYANGKTGTGKIWVDTKDGKYDSFYKSYFNTIKNDSRWTSANPFYYSFHHEQYVKSEGGGTQAGTAADYIAAWRHVHDLMVSTGAYIGAGGNMDMAWVPHWRQFYGDPTYGSWTPTAAVKPYTVTKIWPGAAYVGLIGVDVYHGTNVGSSITAAKQWTPVHKFALDHGLPFITGETGVDGSDSFVVSYLKQVDTLLQSWGAGTGPGQIDAVLWTTRVASDGDYRLDKTSARLAQYRAMAAESIFAGTR